MKVKFITGRFGGGRFPVEAGDRFEIMDDQHNLCLALDAAVVLRMLMCRVEEARIVKMILNGAGDPLAFERLDLRPAPPPEPPKVLMDEKTARAVLRSNMRARTHDAKFCGVPTLSTGEPCRRARPCHDHPEKGDR